MTPAEFQRYLDRDGARCMHCGATAGLVPQHRIGRGMGGSALGDPASRHAPSNVIVLCSHYNGLIESNAEHAAVALRAGWKLHTWQEPLIEPVYDKAAEAWFYLDNDYHRTRME